MEWTNCKECIEFEDCEYKENNDGCFFGTKEEDVEDNTMKGTPYPIMRQLQMRNFKIHERFAEWGTGSISNYRKVKVHAPRMMTSLQDDKQHRAYSVEVETHREPGYIEVDLHSLRQSMLEKINLLSSSSQTKSLQKKSSNRRWKRGGVS